MADGFADRRKPQSPGKLTHCCSRKTVNVLKRMNLEISSRVLIPSTPEQSGVSRTSMPPVTRYSLSASRSDLGSSRCSRTSNKVRTWKADIPASLRSSISGTTLPNRPLSRFAEERSTPYVSNPYNSHSARNSPYPQPKSRMRTGAPLRKFLVSCSNCKTCLVFCAAFSNSLSGVLRQRSKVSIASCVIHCENRRSFQSGSRMCL